MIAVIDYAMGNLHSIAKALEWVGGEVEVTNNPEKLRAAERIVLPGVGAFGEGMQYLSKFGLIEVLREEVLENKKPFLGICLGMQLLADESGEFGSHTGLGWLDAKVKKFDSGNIRVPHIGWNNVAFTQKHPLVEDVKDNADFYFVHSYHVVCFDKSDIVGECDYGGRFTAVVGKDNIAATQFHPEKSQRDGLKILENFINWTPDVEK